MKNSNLKIQVSRYILDESAKTLGKLINANKKFIDDNLVVTGKTFENLYSLAEIINAKLEASDEGLRTTFDDYGDNENENDIGIENEHLVGYVDSKLKQEKSNLFNEIRKQKWVIHTVIYSSHVKFKNYVLDPYVKKFNDKNPLDKYIEPILKREKKIEVIDPPTDICFILRQLQKSGYIKFPTLSSGTIDLDSTVKALKKAFNISVPEDTIKTYFGPARMKKLKLKFDGGTFTRAKKSELVIPLKKKIN